MKNLEENNCIEWITNFPQKKNKNTAADWHKTWNLYVFLHNLSAQMFMFSLHWRRTVLSCCSCLKVYSIVCPRPLSLWTSAIPKGKCYLPTKKNTWKVDHKVVDWNGTPLTTNMEHENGPLEEILWNAFGNRHLCPSKIEWDLSNGPLSKLLELLYTQIRGSLQWVLLVISWIMLLVWF